MTDYVVIIDRSAGNETVGEMWQETKIFKGDACLDEVMDWALPNHGRKFSSRKITITKPHPTEEEK